MDSCNYEKLPATDIESHEVVVVKKTTRAPPTKAKGRSCLKTCLCVVLVLLGMFVTVVLVAGTCAYKWMAGNVEEWTVTEPNSLPVVNVPDEELEIFKDQAKLFYDQIQAGKVPNDFIVTETNLNGLAAASDYLRGNAYAEMESNKVIVSLSLPMDFLPGGKDRYLVGTETLTWDPETSLLHVKMEPLDTYRKTYFDLQFHLSLLDDGKTLNLEVLSGEFLDWTIPQDFIDEHNNLLEDFYDCDNDHDEDCEHVRKALYNLDEVSLEKDQVVFHPRPMAGLHRALAERFTASNKSGWKTRFGRHLVGF